MTGQAGAPGQAQEPDPGRVRRRVLVHGRVQGVGFRISVAREADRVGVTGTVRNVLDGTVEADIEGQPDAVAAMIDWLGEGPASAQVTQTEVESRRPRGAMTFEVR